MSKTIEFNSKEDQDTFVERIFKNTDDYLELLQTPNEIEQIILKTHLCSERLLEEIITISLPNPRAVLSARYTFANKLALVKAVVGIDDSRLETLSKINVLNKIRNQMAHQIDGSKIASFFLKLGIEYPESTELDHDSVQKIKMQIAEIFGGLIAIKEMVILNSQGVDYSVKNL